MLHHHELEKYTFFFSQMAENRSFSFTIQSGVSQFAFIHLQAIEQTFITLKTKTNNHLYKRRSLMLDTIRLQVCQHYDLYRCGPTQSTSPRVLSTGWIKCKQVKMSVRENSLNCLVFQNEMFSTDYKSCKLSSINIQIDLDKNRQWCSSKHCLLTSGILKVSKLLQK